MPASVGAPAYSVQFPSVRPSYVVNFGATAPTAQSDLFAIEAGPTKVVRLMRVAIYNPGMQTTAGLTVLNFVRTKTAGTGGVVTPQCISPVDTTTPTAPSGTPNFTGIVRASPTALGAQDASIAGDFALWVPGAIGAFSPLVIEMGGQGLTYRVPDAPPGFGVAFRHPGAAGATTWYGYAVFCEDDP
jgi:hypothetical protein